VADEVTPTALPSDKTPEEIKQEMAQTRESITEKVAALEHQVVGTVQTAANTLTDTVEAVKSIVTQAPAAVTDTVKHAAEAVSETVRETFDITSHVRRHPWPAVGSAALLGCITGWLFTRRRPSFSALASASAKGESVPSEPAPAPSVRAGEKPGVLDELWGLLGEQGKDLVRTALESVSAAVKQNIQEKAPKLVSEAASRLTGNGKVDEAPFADRFDGARARA
jgi:ElaB/YqjD/DUF883 family membrane-anchored ribosome-binding protein